MDFHISRRPTDLRFLVLKTAKTALSFSDSKFLQGISLQSNYKITLEALWSHFRVILNKNKEKTIQRTCLKSSSFDGHHDALAASSQINETKKTGKAT